VPPGLCFQPRRRDVAEPEPCPSVLGRGEIGAEIEQIVLDASEHRLDIIAIRATRGNVQQTDRCIRLVHRAKRLDARGVLGQAGAIGERGLATVTALRRHPVDPYRPHPARSGAAVPVSPGGS
jgi:hypothetical protein